MLSLSSDNDTSHRDTAIAGGWSPASVTDPGVKKAAQIAFDSLSESPYPMTLRSAKAPRDSYTIVSAASQVVRGTNYRLKLKVYREGEKEFLGEFSSTVWYDLTSYSVTNWEQNFRCETEFLDLY